MKRVSNYSFLVVSIWALLVIGCKEEPKPEINVNLLVGEWDIEEAFRNGKKTRLLQNTFFTFDSDSTLASNLINNGDEVIYRMDRNDIVLDPKFDCYLAVDSISQESLILKGKIQEQRFKLELIKREK